MPILAARRSDDNPHVLIPEDDRTISFLNLDGDVVFEGDGSSSYLVLDDTFGIDYPPLEIVTERFPGLNGSRLTDINVLERDIQLTLWIEPESQDWRDMLALLEDFRALARHWGKDYRNLDGTFKIGSSSRGRNRTMTVVYLAGLEGDYQQFADFGKWKALPLKLRAVDPFWYGQEWSSPLVSIASAQPFLASSGPAHPLRLSSANAIGSGMPVTVTGTVPSDPIIELFGTSASTHVKSDAGLDVTIGSLTSTDKYVLNTGRHRASLLNGVNDWTKVGRAAKWRPLSPGQTSIDIVVSSADETTRARVYGREVFDAPW